MLAFRPPPGYGSGGWGFEALAARTNSRGQRPGLFALLVEGWLMIHLSIAGGPILPGVSVGQYR